jgi:S1-C subfamily serine protease
MLKLVLHLVLLSALIDTAVTAAPPMGDRTPDAVVRIVAVRGFQGLFEWAPGPGGVVPERALGGRWPSSGTIIDLAGIARQLSTPLEWPISRDELYVVTTLRSVHVADEVWIQGVVPVSGGLDGVMEVPGEVIATDAALNLAVVRARQPAEGARFPRGVLLAKTPISRGQMVVRLHLSDWRTFQRRDELWTRGLPNGHQDPFRLDSLPTWWTHGSVNFGEVGGPLLDPKSGRLVGILGTTQREVQSHDNRKSWRGANQVIEARQIATFLRSVLAGEAPTHGSLPDGGPRTQRIDPSLAALLGLPSATGLYALGDWPADIPLIRRGDILLSVGGRSLGYGGMTLAEAVFDLEPGTAARLEYRRGDETLTLDVPVEALYRPTGRDIAWTRFVGAWIQDVPPVMHLEGYDRSGPVVVHVDPGSPAEAGEVNFGMVIHDVLGAGRSLPVTTVAELTGALRDLIGDARFDGELGLRVNDLHRPGHSARVVLLRVEPGTAVEEVTP